MPVSEETLKKLTSYHYRPGTNANHLISRIAGEAKNKRKLQKQAGQQKLTPLLRTAQENLLYFLLCHKNGYHRVNTLVYWHISHHLAILDDEREIIDIKGRKHLQTAIWAIKQHLANHHLEIREIKLEGDRRIKAYGLFDINEPDHRKEYLEHAKWSRLVQDYKQ